MNLWVSSKDSSALRAFSSVSGVGLLWIFRGSPGIFGQSPEDLQCVSVFTSAFFRGVSGGSRDLMWVLGGREKVTGSLHTVFWQSLFGFRGSLVDRRTYSKQSPGGL